MLSIYFKKKQVRSISITKIFLASITGLFCLIVGSSYRDDCPADPKLASWCITFGSCLIVLILLNLFLKLTGFMQNSCKAEGICLYIVAILLSFCILVMLIFLFGWLITGKHAIHSIFEKKSSFYSHHNMI